MLRSLLRWLAARLYGIQAFLFNPKVSPYISVWTTNKISYYGVDTFWIKLDRALLEELMTRTEAKARNLHDIMCKENFSPKAIVLLLIVILMLFQVTITVLNGSHPNKLYRAVKVAIYASAWKFVNGVRRDLLLSPPVRNFPTLTAIFFAYTFTNNLVEKDVLFNFWRVMVVTLKCVMYIRARQSYCSYIFTQV